MKQERCWKTDKLLAVKQPVPDRVVSGLSELHAADWDVYLPAKVFGLCFKEHPATKERPFSVLWCSGRQPARSPRELSVSFNHVVHLDLDFVPSGCSYARLLLLLWSSVCQRQDPGERFGHQMKPSFHKFICCFPKIYSVPLKYFIGVLYSRVHIAVSRSFESNQTGPVQNQRRGFFSCPSCGLLNRTVIFIVLDSPRSWTRWNCVLNLLSNLFSLCTISYLCRIYIFYFI